MTASVSTPHRLLVVGEGEVARALESIATSLGWRPVVVETLEDAVRELPGTESVVVTSHHEGVDGPALAAALGSQAAYVGAMGARKTQERRGRWMADNGVTEDQAARVHGPAGLDIGSNTPAEIAVSIVAEIIAVRHGVPVAGSLRERSGPIHPWLPPGAAECPAG